MRPSSALLALWLFGGCASAPAPPASNPAVPEPTAPAEVSEAPAPAPAEKEEQAVAVPTACDSAGELCLPRKDFVDALCKRRQPNVALTLFQKGSPWTRTYVRARDLEAWLVGGRRASPQKLALFEEVIIVDDRSTGRGGIRVSGAGSYDIVRWDGTCVSVMSDEVNPRRPGEPESATIVWHDLTPGMREALLKDTRIAYRDEQRKEHCNADKGGPRCVQSRERLSRMIAAIIRDGGLRDGGELPFVTELE